MLCQLQVHFLKELVLNLASSLIYQNCVNGYYYILNNS